MNCALSKTPGSTVGPPVASVATQSPPGTHSQERGTSSVADWTPDPKGQSCHISRREAGLAYADLCGCELNSGTESVEEELLLKSQMQFYVVNEKN